MNPIQSDNAAPRAKDTQSDRNALLWIVAEAVLFICCIAAVPFVVYADALFLENQNTEDSITKHLHNVLSFVACGAFVIGAYKYSASRGYLLMAVTFFARLFIREMDAGFNKIRKGFGVYPVLATILAGTFAVMRNKRTILRPFLQHYATRSGTIVYVGVFLLVVFTRLFGTRSLWEAVMGVAYDARLKGVIQEGTELMSYMLIAYGSCLALLSAFGGNTKGKS